MPRPLRTDQPDGYFHVSSLGVDDTFIYRDDDDRRAFLRLLLTVVHRHAWLVHTLCLMGTHYHLVLETTQPRLSRGLQRLNGVYALAFNERHGRKGHLFGARFSSRVLHDEAHLEAACRYVLENPVRAGLCERPEDWPWSAARTGLLPERP